ncbi:hypothetical protein [Asanoa iriomotensis]|uniref:Uncharacterized protein n=1 Tax=Asanoa iriomotensis TaxID=234613 RepID=A0ABQ4BVQ1_9ACTN|nr:hypothetical protein [Asanoa iriomotensis]GIF54613.1 hypothetical protein Air01nite_07080 [Asanoa iriomotensis]
MTSDAVPAGGDARRLLGEVRGLARRVRIAQRVTWLPLLVLAVVTFVAIPVTRVSRPITRDCQPVAGGGETCKVFDPGVDIYWLVAMVVAYIVITRGYVAVARDRGVGVRVLPYAISGVAATVVVFGLIAVGAGGWIVRDPQDLLHPPTSVQVLFRLLTPLGAIGVALLVLAWLERNVALLLFALGYLAVVLVPINFGWDTYWGGGWSEAPPLIISGSVLALGALGFAGAQRLRRAR